MRRLAVALLVLFCCASAGCGPSVRNVDSKGKNIICFGDSLTEGFGAAQGEDYPSYLRQMLPIPVINAGASGNTTVDALGRLQQDVLDRNPKMVIITLGGNDFLRHVPKEQTLRNMEAIIDGIQKRGAMVVWATVKTGVLSDAYTHSFRTLARKKQVLLIEHILRDIMVDPNLMSDQIHPNGQGYKVMAERIYKEIRPLLIK